MKNLAVRALSVLFVSSLAAAASLSNVGARSLESPPISRSQSAKFVYSRRNRGGGHHGGNHGGDNGGNNNGENNNGGNNNGDNNNGDNNNGGNDNNNNGGNNGGNGGGDPQFSTTLDPSQIQDALNNDGTNGDGSEAGIAPSLTSNNNFINFCLTQGVPITNGKQVQEGSCNPTPMGRIVAKDKMPSCKFQFPKNGEIIQANQPFTIKLAVQNFDTGFFANPTTNYFAAPQTVNDQGFLKGHSHVVVEPVNSFTSGNPLNPLDFAFFKGLNAAAVDGVLSTDVTEGLEPGVYKLSSINSSVNHQPALVAVAQHGSLDDTVYFRVVRGNGNNDNNDNNNDRQDRKEGDNPFQ